MSDVHLTIQVVGDATVDWLLAQSSDDADVQQSYSWTRDSTVTLGAQPGGAAALTALLERRFATISSVTVSGMALPAAALQQPSFPEFDRVFTRWALLPREVGERAYVWRQQAFLGQESAMAPTHSTAAESALDRTRCLVIDDTNRGFRDTPHLWPDVLATPDSQCHYILKVASPLAQGRLWTHLALQCPDRVTLYLSVGDLRKENAPIGQPLSWERTGRDVAKAYHLQNKGQRTWGVSRGVAAGERAG